MLDFVSQMQYLRITRRIRKDICAIVLIIQNTKNHYFQVLQRLGVGDAFGDFGEIMGYVDECDIVAGYEMIDNAANATFAC